MYSILELELLYLSDMFINVSVDNVVFVLVFLEFFEMFDLYILIAPVRYMMSPFCCI